MNRRETVARCQDALVLVVDDDVDTCDMYQAAFEVVGLKTICAANVQSALAIVDSDAPSIVVADIGMPGEDGWSLLDALRMNSPDIPVVIVSAHAFPEVRDRARAAGCAAFFPKPCLPLALADELRSLLYRVRYVPPQPS